uniref:Ig-like domain-containing protein n=1 Tax=Clastoptera arizonana TaxID=38151 RepID=A0A1B6E0Q4_9HEMI
MDYWPLYVIWHLCAFWNGDAISLKLTSLSIDKYTIKGNETLLQCKYNLQGEALYSVKWYKDGHEFYRYVPKELPIVQVFPVAGVYVDFEHSNETQVLLTALDLDSSGRYRCEVSAEAPSFQTVSDHSDMVTVALPSRGPTISGGKPRYNLGDTVRVNCTAGPSKPATHLAWFINGEQVNKTYLRHYSKFPLNNEGLEVSVLGLEFRVDPAHFKSGDMKLKCLATISPVYWNSNEESVEGEKPIRPPVMEVKDTSRADRVQASTSFAARLRSYTILTALATFTAVLYLR